MGMETGPEVQASKRRIAKSQTTARNSTRALTFGHTIRENVLPGLHKSSASSEPRVRETLVESLRRRTLTSADCREAFMMSRLEYLQRHASPKFLVSAFIYLNLYIALTHSQFRLKCNNVRKLIKW
jgi:hypothetical protein